MRAAIGQGHGVPTALRAAASFAGRVRAVLAAVCGAAVLLPCETRASELSWDGPTDCAAAEQLAFEVERALGTPLESAGRLQFHVRVESAESTASARLRVSSEVPGEVSKERLLVAAGCSKLVDDSTTGPLTRGLSDVAANGGDGKAQRHRGWLRRARSCGHRRVG